MLGSVIGGLGSSRCEFLLSAQLRQQCCLESSHSIRAVATAQDVVGLTEGSDQYLVATGLVDASGDADASVRDVLVGAGVEAERCKGEGFNELARLGGTHSFLERYIDVAPTARGEVLQPAQSAAAE
uniref:hypothetical protein n=1 Tax=Arthrobacter sp. 68b TaxID=311808 RepID=UPI0020B30A06|nr:hypothetical protein [Arthrobacter sp. 68b]